MKTINKYFEKFYDTVGNFINGGKSIAPNELKNFI